MTSLLPFDINARWLDYLLCAVTGLIFCLAMLSGLPRIAADESIRIVAPLLPPQMTREGAGREAEIINAALRAGGITTQIEIHVVPFTRHWQMFADDPRFDAVTTVPGDLSLAGQRSASYINYQNGIIYNASDFPVGLGRQPLRAIVSKRIVAFAGASAILPEIRAIGDEAPIYLERQDQLSHSIMFANDIVDVVIADHLIFTSYSRDLLGDEYPRFARETVFDPVFCPTPYQMVFRDPDLRDAFNRGLSIIRRNGIFALINAHYADEAGIVEIARSHRGC